MAAAAAAAAAVLFRPSLSWTRGVTAIMLFTRGCTRWTWLHTSVWTRLVQLLVPALAEASHMLGALPPPPSLLPINSHCALCININVTLPNLTWSHYMSLKAPYFPSPTRKPLTHTHIRHHTLAPHSIPIHVDIRIYITLQNIFYIFATRGVENDLLG